MILISSRMIQNLCCAFLVLYPFLIYPWGKDFYYANIKAYYFLLMMLFLVFAEFFTAETEKFPVKHLKVRDWLLIFFLLLVSFSTLLSANPSLIGTLTEHQGILILISYGILFAYTSRRLQPEQQIKILRLIVWSSFFAAFYGILQHFHMAFLPQDRMMNSGTRSFSLFDNADYFGSYLVVMIWITVPFFLFARHLTSRITYLVILSTLFIALLESETRSAWLGTAVGFILIIPLIVRRRRDLRKYFGILFVTFALLFGVVNTVSQQSYTHRAASITQDAQKIVTNQDSGFAGASRWYIWQVSLPLIHEYFWFGSGPNTFQYVFHPATNPNSAKYIGEGPIYDENNDYLQIALTMGVPALVTYLLFLFTVIGAGFKKARQMTGDHQMMMYGLLAAVVGYMIQAFFNISVVSVAPYFWMCLGLVCSEGWECYRCEPHGRKSAGH